MKRRAKAKEKSLEEKAFYKNEKLRDQKRLKRRKELEKQIQSRLLSKLFKMFPFLDSFVYREPQPETK